LNVYFSLHKNEVVKPADYEIGFRYLSIPEKKKSFASLDSLYASRCCSVVREKKEPSSRAERAISNNNYICSPGSSFSAERAACLEARGDKNRDLISINGLTTLFFSLPGLMANGSRAPQKKSRAFCSPFHFQRASSTHFGGDHYEIGR
jgi:hypothetical protein